MGTLPGWALDLLTDGVDLHGVDPKQVRSAVIGAVRRVMFSAHRAEVPYDHMHVLLTDTRTRRLAAQLATGRGGRTIAINQRAALLRRLWDDTGQVVASTPRIDREAIESHLAYVRDALDCSGDDLSARDRNILTVVLNLADAYGTTRVAASSYAIAATTGERQTTVSSVLRRLAADGHWLSLAQRGDHRKGRASLYRVGPGLADCSYMGALPPMSNAPPCPPMSNPPMSNQSEAPVSSPSATLTLVLTREEQAAVLAVLAERRQVPVESLPANVTDLSARRGA